MLINDKVWTIDYFGLFLFEMDDYIYLYPDDVTILQAAFRQDIYLPRFCYHPRLNLVGNCRICFVEEKKSTKPVISCCVNITPEMEIYLDSELAVISRHNVFEFLLSSHPLDCPICDQGGECDLQDQYMTFGADDNRFFRTLKRSVMEKDIGPLIQLSLNRCIQCARCTRFAHDIAGLYTFSLLGRGFNTEISNYIPHFFAYEMSGNIIDLCPVGALTYKTYNFKYRYWELIDQKHVDVFDILHPYIRIDYLGIDLMRITPALTAELDEEWISDLIRFNTDAFYQNRLLEPSFRADTYIVNMSWKYAYLNIKFNYINNIKKLFKINKNFLHFLTFSDIFNDYLALSVYTNSFDLINFFNVYNNVFSTKNDFRTFIYIATVDFSLLNNVILINTNTRLEFPIINIKIREKLHYDYIDCFLFGFASNLNFFFIHFANNFKFFPVYIHFSWSHLADNDDELNFFLANHSFSYAENLYDFLFLFFFFSFFDIRIFNLTSFSNFIINSKEMGLNINLIEKKENFNYLSNSIFSIKGNNLENYGLINLTNSLNIYFGHHFEEAVDNSNFILPTKFFFESSAVYINLLGVLDNYSTLYYTYVVPGTKDDFTLLYFFFTYFSIKWDFTKEMLIENLYSKTYVLLNYPFFKEYDINNHNRFWHSINTFFNSFLNDFYLSNIVNENSISMLISSKKLTIKNDFNFFFNLDFNKWIF